MCSIQNSELSFRPYPSTISISMLCVPVPEKSMVLAEPPMVGELHTNVAVSVTATNKPGTSPQRVQGNYNR